jgi:IS1 family transposase
VIWQQSHQAFQQVVDQVPHAVQYFSDHNPIYPSLVYYPGKFNVSDGKSDAFSVEGVNAELRHYLARLVRRSRCFSRCPYALECAIKLFVF